MERPTCFAAQTPFCSQAHLLLTVKFWSSKSQSHGSQPPLSQVLEKRMRCRSSKKGSNFRKSNFPSQCLKPRPVSSFTHTLLRMRLDLTNHPIPSTILRPWVISLDESCISALRAIADAPPSITHALCTGSSTLGSPNYTRALDAVWSLSWQVVHPRLFVRPLGTSPSAWPPLGCRRGDNTCSCIQPFCPLPTGRVHLHRALFVSPTINMQGYPHIQRRGAGRGRGRMFVGSNWSP